MLRLSAAAWGFTGVTVFLAYTIYRLLQHTIVAFDYSMSMLQWTVLVLNVIFMAYSEGYKGFQKSFSPRVAARVLYLSQHATWMQALFAPLFCMGYFGTTKRRQITAFILTAGLVLLVMLIRMLDQPWRGIIDAGVVVGLGWGLISFIIFVIQAFTQQEFSYSAEVKT